MRSKEMPFSFLGRPRKLLAVVEAPTIAAEEISYPLPTANDKPASLVEIPKRGRPFKNK